MAESYSVKATLSATDSGFSSTLKNAIGATETLGDRIKNGFNFGFLAGAGQKAFSALIGGAQNLLGEIDSSNAAWKTFSSNMSIIGKSEREINAVKKELQSFAEQTVYSSSDMATTFAQLEAVGVKNTTNLVKGFGGLAAAAENPQQAMKTLSQQATQMAAKPTVAWADFKLMLEQTPAGIAAVAKEMGMSTAEMVTAVQEGEVSTQAFFDAITSAGTSDSFSKLATESKTIGQAMDGLTETVANKVMPSFDILSQVGIDAVDKIAGALGKIDAGAIANKVSSAVDFVKRGFAILKTSFAGIGTDLKAAFDVIASSFSGLQGTFNKGDILERFGRTCRTVAGAIRTVSDFIVENKATIQKYLPIVTKLVGAFAAYKVINTVAPGITSFAGSLAKMAGKGIAGLATKLLGIAAGQKAAGTAAATSSTSIMQSALATLALGAAVALTALGIGLLVQSAIALSDAGLGACVALLALVGVIALLAVGATTFGAGLTAVAPGLIAFGAAIALVGAGALLAAASLAVISAVLPTLITLGASGALAIMQLGAGMAYFAVGATLAGAACVVLGAGLVLIGAAILAMGAGMLLFGAGAMLAAASLSLLSLTLPTLAAYGMQAAGAIAVLGASLLAYAIGAGVAGIATIALGAGLLVVSAAVLVLSAAVLVLCAGVLVVAAAFLVAAAAIALVSVVLPLIANYGTNAATAMVAMSGAMVLLGAGSLVAGAGLAVFGVALLAISVSAVAFGVAMTAAAVGVAAMGVALLAVSSQMKTISKNAKSAEKSIKSMKSSVKVVESSLDALGSKAKSAMKKLTDAFSNTEKSAKKSGTNVGKGFTSGMQTGLAQAPAVAVSVTSVVSASLMTGKSRAYQAGAYISQGFAQGMLSCLAVVTNAANQLAAQADKAIRAKAKIKSPSRVAMGLGEYWGEGFAEGIAGTAREVWNAAQELVSIPTISVPNFAMAYGGELSADYDYYRNAQYTIEVPVSIDGKEFARVSASHMQNELNKRAVRDSRKHGKA